jgi:hypothetical protein
VLEDQIRAGHPDLHGLCLALADWSAELRLIEKEAGQKVEKPAAAEAGRAIAGRADL